jgi:hypothetical protein
VKCIPLLAYFADTEIQWSSYEDRLASQRYFPSKIQEGFENTTLILGVTTLPIQHCRTDQKEGENGVWDGAHKMWGMRFKSLKAIKFIVLIRNKFILKFYLS